jgi:hypothetical protein
MVVAASNGSLKDVLYAYGQNRWWVETGRSENRNKYV